MLFDIRTHASAINFLQEFLQTDFASIEYEYIVEDNLDFNIFWAKWLDQISSISIDEIKYLAFHVTSSSNDCLEIKSNGIKNLQSVLSEKTNLKSKLQEYGVRFDIENKLLFYRQQEINIDYDKYKGHFDLSPFEKRIERVAHKIYYDFQVDAFFLNCDISNYGTRIHQRPEFLYNLVNLFPELKDMENEWIDASKGYIVTFHASFDQFAWFTFYEQDYEYQDDLEKKLKLKKWLVSRAISRIFDPPSDYSKVFAYMKPEIIILPNQIIEFQEIAKK